jgi:hypothetical protein
MANMTIVLFVVSQDGKSRKKKIPQKVLQNFPLAPRLKRMFANKEASEEAQQVKVAAQ